MSGFLVTPRSQHLGIPTSYLERSPFDGSIEYMAPNVRFATVFDDPLNREPEAYCDGR